MPQILEGQHLYFFLRGGHPQGTGLGQFQGAERERNHFNCAHSKYAWSSPLPSKFLLQRWPGAKALPSTPRLLHLLGMWEKLVTLGLPIVWCLSRQECEHSKASPPPHWEPHREGRDSVEAEQEGTRKCICEICPVLSLPSFLLFLPSSEFLSSSSPPSLLFCFLIVLFSK